MTEKTNPEGKTYWTVDCAGAKSVTVTLKTNNSTDYEASGAFNPGNASPAKQYWEPVDYTAKPDVNNGGEFTVTYKNTTNANTVDVYVWWPKEGYTLVSAVKKGGSSSQATTPQQTQPQQTQPQQTQPQQTQPQQQITAVSKYGDVNEDGTVDIMDVIILNKFLLGGKTLSNQAKANADVNADNAVNESDSLLLLKAVVSLVDANSFPIK